MNYLLLELPFTYVLSLIIFTYILWKVKHYYDFRNKWKKFGIDGPPGLPFLGMISHQIIGDPTKNENKWIKKYGKVYGTMRFNTPLLRVADNDLIKLILVKDFNVFQNRGSIFNNSNEIISNTLFMSNGEHWKRMRNIVIPTFTSHKIKMMSPLINNCVDNFIEKLKRQQNDEECIMKIFGSLGMDVISSCAFGITPNDESKEISSNNNKFVDKAEKIFHFDFKSVVTLMMPKPVFNLLNFQTYMGSIRDNKFFFDAAKYLIEYRRMNNITKNDYLQLLMDCQVEDDDVDKIDQNENRLPKEATKSKRLTENEIIAQSFLFFLAGYESTAVTLSLVAYELALHQDIQEQLFQEVSKAPRNSDNEIEYETLIHHHLLNAVIQETLRKDSPLVYLEREAKEKYELGDTGIILNPGDLVEIPVYAIHNCEDYYSEPDQFKPERFLPENKHLLKPYTFLPFGDGPRNCVGMRFSMTELKMILVKLILNFRFVRSENTDVPLKHYYKAFMNGTKNIKLKIEIRT